MWMSCKSTVTVWVSLCPCSLRFLFLDVGCSFFILLFPDAHTSTATVWMVLFIYDSKITILQLQLFAAHAYQWNLCHIITGDWTIRPAVIIIIGILAIPMGHGSPVSLFRQKYSEVLTLLQGAALCLTVTVPDLLPCIITRPKMSHPQTQALCQLTTCKTYYFTCYWCATFN